MLLMTLPASLSKNRKLHLDNTPELADAIATKPSTKGAGLIVPKPVLKPIMDLVSGDHDVMPIELLHALDARDPERAAILAWAGDVEGARAARR
jgi:hypothetical protein